MIFFLFNRNEVQAGVRAFVLFVKDDQYCYQNKDIKDVKWDLTSKVVRKLKMT